MKNSKTKELLQKIKVLKKDMENITEKEYLEFLNNACRFRTYSMNNIMLIMAQKNEASQVASFKKWKEEGRTVKKGSKAIQILAPCFIKRNKEEEEDVAYFRYVNVFDISDTEGKQIKGWSNAKSKITIKEAKETCLKIDKTLKIEDKAYTLNQGGAYSRKKHTIYLNSNLTDDENVYTLFHELSHSLLNHGNTDQGTQEKEQEAETLNYLFCKYYNVENSSSFYLKYYKGIAENTNKIIKTYNKAMKSVV